MQHQAWKRQSDSLTYTTEAQTKSITSVVVDGLSVTYTVSGNVQTNAGNYTMIITGTGNFTGSVTVAWDIAKRPMSDVSIANIPNRFFSLVITIKYIIS